MKTESGISRTLDQAGRAMKLAGVAWGVFWWTAVCLSAWLGLCVVDNLLHLPAGLRLPLGMAAAALAGAGLYRRVLRPALQRRRTERTAVLLERRQGIRDNVLINAFLLERQRLAPGEQAFAEQTRHASLAALGEVRPDLLWEPRRLWRWGAAAGVVLAVWCLYAALYPRQAGNALARYALPLGDVPPAGSFVLEVTPGRDLTLCEGDDLSVAVAIRSAGGRAGAPLVAPSIQWSERDGAAALSRGEAEIALMRPSEQRRGFYGYTFRHVQRRFAFRVVAGDSCSRGVRVTVLAMPRLCSSVFRITPPAYTGLGATEAQGPPAPVNVLGGSALAVAVGADRPLTGALWEQAGRRGAMKREGPLWAVATVVTSAGPYRLTAKAAKSGRDVLLASGEVGLLTDRPPDVDFQTDDRNRYVAPGAEIALSVQASDDYGVRWLGIAARVAEAGVEGPSAGRLLHEWRYLGPPGNPGPLREAHKLRADPAVFEPGQTYLVEALCADFRPGAEPSRSRPIVLRVQSWRDLEVPQSDPVAAAFGLLQRTIVEQKKANDLSGNLRAHLDEAVGGGNVPAHRDAMHRQQSQARELGRQAAEALQRAAPEERASAAHLRSLAEHEMGWVLGAVQALKADAAGGLGSQVDTVRGRQDYILDELVALLGRLARESKERLSQAGAAAREEPAVPAITVADAASDLKADLEQFAREQKRVVRATQSLMDKAPDDLTKEEEKILGELAREEEKWARFIEEKLTDFGKLPLQDFADGTLSQELNEVFQEVAKAAESLYQKKVELAVPQEQSGLELAQELVHNLERWLAGQPDSTQWSMEEPPSPPDVPMAELPAELEDIVGELMDREEAMAEDVEDVSSSWMDSLDKGAGWSVGDGPISDMSARGITGDLLPNQQEVGGRSGEGRTGRSMGQMVESAAEGKGGRDTPTRLTPSPFEPGSVEDKSTEQPGGATGGGKLSGFSPAGLRGPTPPPAPEQMKRLSMQQAEVRQDAEALALRLRKHNLPSGDLEAAVEHMRRVEVAGARGDGLTIRRAYSRVLDSLAEARSAVHGETGLRRESSTLPPQLREGILTGLRERTPRGYEEMAAEYFRRLGEGGAK